MSALGSCHERGEGGYLLGLVHKGPFVKEKLGRWNRERERGEAVVEWGRGENGKEGKRERRKERVGEEREGEERDEGGRA